MKKINYLIVGGLLSLCCASNLYAQNIFSEDFSTASGQTPPTNWTNDDMNGSGLLWSFDNPGERTFDSPISEPFAILDSDYFFVDTDEETALVMPMFDASAYSGNLLLQFDQYVYEYFNCIVYVEVFNGTSWVEVANYTTTDEETEHVLLDITAAANGAADAQVRFRWTGNYAYYWTLDNITLDNSNCPPVVFLNVSNEETDGLDLTWIAGGTEGNWNIEWGLPGFTPGTGTEVGSGTSTQESYTVTGLNAGTDYVFYVQSDCGGGEEGVWIAVNGTTLCAPITALPYMENFDGITNVDYGIYPNCWYSEQQYWLVDNGYNTWNTAPYSGDNFLAINYYDEDAIWTPEFELTAGTTYELSFMFAGDGYDGWNAEVLVNTSQTSVDAEVLNQFIVSGDVTTADYQKSYSCFTPTVSGVYSFGFHVSSNNNPYYFVTIDDVQLYERATSAGTDGSVTVCQTEGLVDLNAVATITDANGTWNFTPNPSTIENGDSFNPEFVPSGTVTVEYITVGCLEDTVVAEITIMPASQAGIDGDISVCKNEPVSLYDGLTGVVNVGGTWYDPLNNELNSSLITSSNFGGSYTYKYIVGNGVCADDTANVIVNVDPNCDNLSLSDEDFAAVKVYPNPSTGLVFIESNDLSFNITVLDVNGREVNASENQANNGVKSIDLSNVQKGIYFINLSTANSNKVYKVVIN